MKQTAEEILSKYSYYSEYAGGQVITIEDAIKALEEYASQREDAMFELFNKPMQVLKPLEDLYRKENPEKDGKFYCPDTTEFYKWIVEKIMSLPSEISEEEIKKLRKKLFSMRYSSYDVMHSNEHYEYIDGWHKCINELLKWSSWIKEPKTK